MHIAENNNLCRFLSIAFVLIQQIWTIMKTESGRNSKANINSHHLLLLISFEIDMADYYFFSCRLFGFLIYIMYQGIGRKIREDNWKTDKSNFVMVRRLYIYRYISRWCEKYQCLSIVDIFLVQWLVINLNSLVLLFYNQMISICNNRKPCFIIISFYKYSL